MRTKDIGYETLSGISLFSEEIRNSFLFHIPHSSTYIPRTDDFFEDKIEENLNLLTDHSTDKIFDLKEIDKIVTPFSRVFCDVERFEDDFEPMYLVGRGFYYTKGYDGSELRKLNEINKQKVYEDFYKKHHELFYKKAKEKLDQFGITHIIDCHSFNAKALNISDDSKYADFCFGTDPFHTPKYLVNRFVNYFKSLGYSVEIDVPYAGTIVPKPFFKTDSNVKSLMIEVNQRLYMEGGKVLEDKVDLLRNTIQGYFEKFL